MCHELVNEMSSHPTDSLVIQASDIKEDNRAKNKFLKYLKNSSLIYTEFKYVI